MNTSFASAVSLDSGQATPLRWYNVWSYVIDGIGELRCRLLHRSFSHPVRGHYRCWTCLREYKTGW